MRLFFCNLPYSVTERHIEALLLPFGVATEVEIPIDRDKHRSRGVAFADLPDDAARLAKKALNGSEYGGRTLRVEEARPKEPRPDVVRLVGAKRTEARR